MEPKLTSTYTSKFIEESIKILRKIDQESIDLVAEQISKVKKVHGRIFFAGSGGGAGHSSHATCDFRKLAGIESYCITDNVSELTARVNDESWADSYASWLKVSRFSNKDLLFVFSVGGGSVEDKISENLIGAMKHAKSVGGAVTGIVGRDGGFLAQVSDQCIIVPTVDEQNVTTQTEGFQALLWHLLVCHPLLESSRPMWESVSKTK